MGDSEKQGLLANQPATAPFYPNQQQQQQPQQGYPQQPQQPQQGYPQQPQQPQQGYPQQPQQPQQGYPPQPQQGQPQQAQGGQPQGQPPAQGAPVQEYHQPPAAAVATAAGPRAIQLPETPRYSQERARDLLKDKMKGECCKGQGAADGMAITHIEPRQCIKYTFLSFTEKRMTTDEFIAYEGQQVDGPEYGMAPDVWQIMVNPPAEIKNSSAKMQVPHTAVVKACVICNGSGRTSCNKCNGSGQANCHHCHSSGKINTAEGRKVCHNCHGAGHHQCRRCTGSGTAICDTCKGAGRVMQFTQLTVTWTVQQSIKWFQQDLLGLPVQKMATASGVQLFQENLPMVPPLSGTGIVALDAMSAEVVQYHATAFPNERILTQKHEVHCYPVTKFDCTAKEKGFQFWVYGNNELVMAKNYPSGGCCTIL